MAEQSELGDNGPREAIPRPPSRKRRPWVPPQNAVNDIWSRFSVKIFSNVTAVLPISEQPKPAVISQGRLVNAEFEEKAEACRTKVAKIVEEQKRVNQRYRDPHFDIDIDLKFRTGNCLGSLTEPVMWFSPYPDPAANIKCPCLPKGQLKCPCRRLLLQENPYLPKSVKRVRKIFNSPKFSPAAAMSADIKQGERLGNCWLMASLSAMANVPKMIQSICVAQNTSIGVYGFLFYRDGEWISSIIDDNLYLNSADWDLPSAEKYVLMKTEREDAENEHRRIHQTGSKALWGAHCRDQNETWLPLLEKAFAKAHGDYGSLDGGFPGEGLEDLTGGVTTELMISDIWNEDDFWNNELKKINQEFLFGCSTGVLDGNYRQRGGIQEGHAYTVMEVKEREGREKLLKLRNPWGINTREGSWLGAWSDGSKEWTAETLKELNHQQGLDSVFWIRYEDFLRKFQVIDRTRLFLYPDSEWRLTQQWTSIDVPWNVIYREKFRFTLNQDSAVVIVLSQLDDRYFHGLEGQYRFTLNFRLHSQDKLEPEAYVARSHGKALMKRSVAVDLPELKKDTYCVFVKVLAERNPDEDPVEKVVENMCREKKNNEKFSQVGMSYNIAHAKGSQHMKDQMRVQMNEEKTKRKVRYKREAQRARKYDEKRRQKEQIAISTVAVNMELPVRIAEDTGTTSTSKQVPAVSMKASTTASPSRPFTLQRSESATEPGAAQIEPSQPIIADTISTQHDVPTASLPPSLTVQPLLETRNADYYQFSSSPILTDSKDDSSSDSDYERAMLRTLSYDPPPSDENNDVDPWNAVCMLGLRVYSKDPDLSIEVIMPGQGEQAGLDIDDKLAAMTAPAGNEEQGPESPERARRLRRLMTL